MTLTFLGGKRPKADSKQSGTWYDKSKLGEESVPGCVASQFSLFLGCLVSALFDAVSILHFPITLLFGQPSKLETSYTKYFGPNFWVTDFHFQMKVPAGGWPNNNVMYMYLNFRYDLLRPWSLVNPQKSKPPIQKYFGPNFWVTDFHFQLKVPSRGWPNNNVIYMYLNFNIHEHLRPWSSVNPQK